jgi:hypothetical protein
MSTPEQDNHDAKTEANKHLDEINDMIDRLKKEDVARPDDLQKFKNETEALLDQIQEDINANRIKAADDKIRNFQLPLADMVRRDALRRPIEAKFKEVRKAKRKITLPALADCPPGDTPRKQQSGTRSRR